MELFKKVLYDSLVYDEQLSELEYGTEEYLSIEDNIEDDFMSLKYALDITCENSIIAIADLGLWDGHHMGYKVLGSNIKNTLRFDYDRVIIGTDSFDYKMIGIHHDGRNSIVFRELKDEKHLDIVCRKIYDGTITKKEISRYTRTLKHKVEEAYYGIQG